MSEATCVAEGCTAPIKYKAARLCGKHYQRRRKTGDPLGVRPGRWDDHTRPVCSVEGCNEPAHGRGLCTVHGPRNRRHGDPTAGRRRPITGCLAERFWLCTEVRGPDECWPWQGCLFTSGYAQLYYEGWPFYAHRVAVETIRGLEIPGGMQVDHRCHNMDPECPGGACGHRRCVNPLHLEIVTPRENAQRGAARRRGGWLP